jgi:hypothetical protein
MNLSVNCCVDQIFSFFEQFFSNFLQVNLIQFTKKNSGKRAEKGKNMANMDLRIGSYFGVDVDVAMRLDSAGHFVAFFMSEHFGIIVLDPIQALTD